MADAVNQLGQPIGHALPQWSPPPRPSREPMAGHYCRVETIDPARHAADLHEANGADGENRIWTYLPYGPFAALDDYRAWMDADCRGDDPLFQAVVDNASGKAVGVASYLRINPAAGSIEVVDNASGKAVGVASYLRINPAAGSIEVGHINYSPALQKTPAATEAMYLMMKRVFDLGYRRYEWKCDARNAGSKAAAQRLGLSYEGVFRQATVYKGRNRDTAWYAAIDSEWPALRDAFEGWLDPANFDDDGGQRRSLSAATGPLLVSSG